MIEVNDLSFRYPRAEQPIFAGHSFKLDRGEIMAVLGPNGSGKTTLIKVLLGLLQADRGRITINGRPSYVPQETQSPFDYSVREIVVMGAAGLSGFFASPGPRDYERTEAVLERVGMIDLIDRSFARLSGGQKQMVLIARALVSNPDMLILDEPTSALDYHNQDKVLRAMCDASRQGKTVIFSTHCPHQALHVSHKVLLVNACTHSLFGDAAEVLSADNLTALYRLPILRRRLGDTDIIVPRYHAAD